MWSSCERTPLIYLSCLPSLAKLLSSTHNQTNPTQTNQPNKPTHNPTLHILEYVQWLTDSMVNAMDDWWNGWLMVQWLTDGTMVDWGNGWLMMQWLRSLPAASLRNAMVGQTCAAPNSPLPSHDTKRLKQGASYLLPGTLFSVFKNEFVMLRDQFEPNRLTPAYYTLYSILDILHQAGRYSGKSSLSRRLAQELAGSHPKSNT